MDHDAIGDGITEEDVSEMIKILDKAKIPDTIPDKKIKIATWNIRNFGGSRENIYIHHIAEVLNRFNLIAIIELKDNTEDLEKVMKILGPYWKVIYSDTNMDQKGNKERIGYLYDGRIIEFTNLAAEADPIRENFATKERLTDRINSYNRIKKEEKKELIEILKKIKSSDEIKHYVRVEEFVERIETDYESSRLKHIVKRMRKSGTFMETQNWWRSPYLVSFKAGNFDFVMLAAHLRWGDHESERRDALEELADWIKKKKRTDTYY